MARLLGHCRLTALLWRADAGRQKRHKSFTGEAGKICALNLSCFYSSLPGDSPHHLRSESPPQPGVLKTVRCLAESIAGEAAWVPGVFEEKIWRTSHKGENRDWVASGERDVPGTRTNWRSKVFTGETGMALLKRLTWETGLDLLKTGLKKGFFGLKRLTLKCLGGFQEVLEQNLVLFLSGFLKEIEHEPDSPLWSKLHGLVQYSTEARGAQEV